MFNQTYKIPFQILPMERMKQNIKYVSIGMYKQLEEENKNLTKCNLNLQEWLDNKEKVNKSLREENKNLRDYADNLDSENDNQAIEIEELKKENKNLKEEIEHLEFDIEAWKKLKAVWEKKEQKLQIEI